MKASTILIFLLMCLLIKNIFAQETALIKKTWINENLRLLDFRDSLAFYEKNFISDSCIYKIDIDSLILIPKFVEHEDSIIISTNTTKFKILKLTEDSLILKNYKIWKYSDYNLLDKSNINFESIFLSSTTCYGTCPSFKIQINQNGKLHFQGRKYVDNYIGYYSATLNQNEIAKLDSIITEGAIIRLPNKLPMGMDFPIFSLLVKYNGIQKKVKGCDFPLISWKVITYLRELYKSADLEKIDNFNFLE